MGKYTDLVRRLVSLGQWVLVASVVLPILYFVATAYHNMGGSVPFMNQSLDELEEICIARTMQTDGRSAGDTSNEVRLEIGKTVVRHSNHYNIPICDVADNSLTLTAPGFKRYGQQLYLGRKDWFVKWFESNSASAMVDIKLLRDNKVTKNSVTGCATHYIRGWRITNLSSQSPWRAVPALVAATMSVGKAKNAKGEDVGEAEFLCPIPHLDPNAKKP